MSNASDAMDCSEGVSRADSSSVLYDKGLALLGSGQEKLALKFFEKGLERDPENLDILKTYGETLADLGEQLRAKEVFERLAKSNSKEGWIWMYLGQLEEGKLALECFQKGIEALKERCASAGLPEGERLLCLRELSCAYCTVAELYMSDLCFESCAETECEKYLSLANEACEDNPQASQGMANFYLSQAKPEKARPVILRTFFVIEELMRKISAHDDANGTGTEDDDETFRIDEIEDLLPPLEFRLTTCRILFELKEYSHCISLLEKLLVENDEIVIAWLLLAQCYFFKSTEPDTMKSEGKIPSDFYELALECVEHAQNLGQRLTQSDQSLGTDPQFTLLMSQTSDLKAKIESAARS